MNFGEVERVKTRSYIARRANWDDDMFIFAQIPANINEETIPKMQSLPDVVKREIFADDWETKSDDVLAKWENI